MTPRPPICLRSALRGGVGDGLRGWPAPQVNPMTPSRAGARSSGALARI